jgi:hypothetical protein
MNMWHLRISFTTEFCNIEEQEDIGSPDSVKLEQAVPVACCYWPWNGLRDMDILIFGDLIFLKWIHVTILSRAFNP